ncbi:MAG: cytochrome c biogenesis protein CcsA [Bacteroidetes bacterium]|nr:cytochrome c biogenesis protein CcsA [Bacteroidota bacterium]
MQIQYIGEHLLPGQLGNFFVVLSFAASFLAFISYYFASKEALLDNSWRAIARASFRIHAISVVGISATLFYMIFNHYFEYQYVWQHSSKALPVRYMLSCFWEGQEGSFLLWTFWHAILGLILIRVGKTWEAPVMAVFSSVQIFLASMLLGVFVFDYRLGSNPFMLLREHPEFMNLPFVKVPDYLKSLDGRGLNPLLQNYWMTIHPPILFLGFASTLVPFAYAMAGLWKQRFTDWMKPALPWTFFGVMILGTGILMGGAWAYESLSFGGFWAWDPVENASLVPWLTFVAAAHVMLINKNNGQSLSTSFILVIVTFLLILYSTFLTRSGILGDTSVHAFTDLGMSGQLLIYLLFFLVWAIVLLAMNWKKIPALVEEESATSREFWMFIGALVLVISSFQIIATTSIPVINKLFGTKIAPPLNAVEHYNSWQVPFAILISILIGLGQYFKFKKTDMNDFYKKIVLPFMLASILAVIAAIGLGMNKPFHYVLLFTSIFAILANANYAIRVLKGKISKAGSSIAHVGFGMILLGALISTSLSQTISSNTSGIDITKLGKDFSNSDNIMLRQNDTLRMGDYYVTYSGKHTESPNIYYQINYLSKDATGKYAPEFTLNPLVQTNPRMGNIAEPDTRHFWYKDVYTHITYADLEDKSTDTAGYKEPKTVSMKIGDTLFASNSIVILDGLVKDVDRNLHQLKDSDIAVGADLRILDVNGKIAHAVPLFIIKGAYLMPEAANVDELGLQFAFTKIDTETGKIDISLMEKKSNVKDFIIMKAIIFPGINILWLGCLIMIIGTVLAILQRLKKVQLK